MGRRAMMTLVEGISDAGLRRGYLHRVRFRRLLVYEWLKWADTRASKEKLAAYTAVIQKPGRLKEVFRRLLTVGVRLNAQRDPEPPAGADPGGSVRINRSGAHCVSAAG